MRKFLSFLLAITLIIIQFPNVGQLGVGKDIANADSTDIIVEKVKISDANDITKDKSTIRQNESFKLTITLKNNYGEGLNNVAVGIKNSSSFRLSNSGSKKTVAFADTTKGSTDTVTFDLKYNGGDETQLPITIYYKTSVDSEILSIEDYVSITQAIPTGPPVTPQEPTPPPVIDETKYVPNISIISSKTILAEAGQTVSIPITIKNASGNSAYNVSSTIELDGESPIYIDGSGYSSTSSLNGGKSENLSFKVKVDKRAEDKVYPIKVSFKFNNSFGIAFTSSETIYIKVSNKSTGPQVVVNRLDIKPAIGIQAGGVVTVGFQLQNRGDSAAKDVKVSLNGLKTEGFTLVSGLSTQTLPILDSKSSKYVFFQLKSSSKIAAGSHELDMTLSYKDNKNVEVKDENKFFIPIDSNKTQSSNLIIQNISYPTGSIGLNKDVDVSFTIRNQGQSDAKNIIITAESADPSGLVPKSVSIIKLNSLSHGATKKVNYKFLTTKAAETKNYLVNIKVEYEDNLSTSEEKPSITQFVGIFVLAPDAPAAPGEPIKTTPKLIIDKYDFNPTLVRAGENFQMNLSFFNTNSKKAVKNIKIFLTAEPNAGTNPDSPSAGSSVFTPVDSSNTFYIDSIAPKGKVQKTITMFTVSDAVAKTHTITANFEYEDEKGEAYTATELIGVPVIQQSRLETGELNYYPEAFLGEPIPIALEFYNTGKVPLYNMMVKLEGDFQTENGSYYIGNFENGSSEFYEGMVIPNGVGPLEGQVVFTYEDSTGEIQELRRDFSLNVMEAEPMEEFPGEYPPDDGGGGIKGILKSKTLWITLILIAASGGGIFFLKKKKKKKEEEWALDE